MSIPFERLQGKYEILEKIQEGGMGAVYKVRHRLLEEVRVIKVMRPHLAKDEVLRERFFREAKIAIRLRHRNLAQFYDFTMDDDGTAFIVMEFIDGVNIQDLLASSQRPSLGLALEIACQTLDVLGYLHSKKVIHRDIAPDNLILARSEDDEPLVKLIDLGIAKVREADEGLTKAGTFIGKLRYCSPEHFRTHEGAEVDERSDLYSFGIVLYELVTGTYPIRGRSTSGLIAGHLVKDPIEFSASDRDGLVPDDLRAMIMRSLDKQPEERFQDAHVFRTALAEVKNRFAVDEQELDEALQAAVVEKMPRQRPGSTQDRMDRHFGLTTTPPPRSEDGPVPVEPPPLPDSVKTAPPPTGQDASQETTEVGATDHEARKREAARQQRVKALLLGAEKLVELHHYDEARLQLETALELDPDNQEAPRQLTAVDSAIAKRRELRARAAQKIADLLAAGELDQAAGDLEAAAGRLGEDTEFKDLRSRIGEAAESERARASRVQEGLETARALIAEESFEDAIEALQQALESDPGNEEVAELLARAREAHEKKLEDLRRAREIEDTRAAITAHLDADKLDDAERALAVAQKLYGKETSFDDLDERLRDLQMGRRKVHAAQLRREANKLLNRKRFVDAIKRLDESLLLVPDDPETEELLATAKLRLQRFEEEQEHLRAVSSRVEAIDRLILAGRFETAVHQIEQAVDELGNFEQAAQLRARVEQEAAARQEHEAHIRGLLEKAVECAASGDGDGARKALDEAQREVSEAPELEELIERTQAEIQQQAEARRRGREIAKAVESIQGDIDRGDLDEAERELAVALRLYGDEEVFSTLEERIQEAREEQRRARVEQLLREALGKQASFTEVIAKLEEALTIDPTNVRVQQLLAETRGALTRYQQEKRTAAIAQVLIDIDGLIAAGSFEAALEAVDAAEKQHGAFREAKTLRHRLKKAMGK